MPTLACPSCESTLNKTSNGAYACPACKINLPVLDGVAFAWSDPGSALLDWRNRFDMALADLHQQLLFARGSAPGTEAGAARIGVLIEALETHHEELNTLLAPLKARGKSAKETHLALQTRLPSHHGVLSYMQHIHRDWAWGDDECELVLAVLLETLGEAQCKRVCILGSGGGRLAYDLHAKLEPEQTWALDSNPLLSLLANKICNGDDIALVEFPTAPIDGSKVAVPRTLAGRDALDGLNFVCADAMRPPFRAGSFDLVVTPWLVDVIDVGVGTLMDVIAHLLAPEGRWLMHGSLAFPGTDPRNRIGPEELAEIATSHGFTVIAQRDDELPYLQSPVSRNRRVEVTHTLLAQRGDGASHYEREDTAHLPAWIVHTDRKVPLSPAFQSQAATTRIHAFIMSLIDGERTIKDMAAVMEAQRLMTAAEAAQAIRGFLAKMHEEAQTFTGQAPE